MSAIFVAFIWVIMDVTRIVFFDMDRVSEMITYVGFTLNVLLIDFMYRRFC